MCIRDRDSGITVTTLATTGETCVRQPADADTNWQPTNDELQSYAVALAAKKTSGENKMCIRDRKYPVRGSDLSHYQGDVDWQVLSQEGIQFACIKATEGSSSIDPNFHQNFQRAIKTLSLIHI